MKLARKSEAERKRDRDELEATTKKKKTPRVTSEVDDEATVTTVSDITTTSTGGDPIKAYRDPHGCWWPGVADESSRPCKCGKGNHYSFYCPYATEEEKQKDKAVWAANHRKKGSAKVTAKLTKPVKIYKCMEDAVAASATTEGPFSGMQAIAITQEAPANVYYTNENGAASNYTNLTFDPASTDHILNNEIS